MEKNPLHDIIARTCLDRSFREDFIKNAAQVLRRAGIQVPEGIAIQVIENTDGNLHIVLPSGPHDEPAEWAHEKASASREEITVAGLTIEWDRASIRLSGRITADNAPTLRQELEKVTEDLYIDFREVTFMGSAGLGVFLATQKRLAGDSKKLYLGNVCVAVRNIFSLTGMEPFFKFIDSEALDGWWTAYPIV